MPQSLTKDMKRFMEDNLQANDEVTATAMKNLFLEKWPDLKVSIPTISGCEEVLAGCVQGLTTVN